MLNMMRITTASLMVAAAILVFLLNLDMLRLTPSSGAGTGELSEPTAAATPLASVAGEAAEASKDIKGANAAEAKVFLSTHQQGRENNISGPLSSGNGPDTGSPDNGSENPAAGGAADQQPQAPSDPPRSREVSGLAALCDAARDFLSGFDPGSGQDAEEALGRVLVDKARSGGAQVQEAEMVFRMCLWRGFVCLQQPGGAPGCGSLDQDFERELALKRAGFRAMGLDLPESMVEQARRAVRERMASLAAKEGGS